MSKEKASDELLAAFDAGEDMEVFFDYSRPSHPNREVKRVNVDFPPRGCSRALRAKHRASASTGRP